MKSAAWLLLSVLPLQAGPLRAWETATHTLITRLALEKYPALKAPWVPPETFDHFLRTTRFGDKREFDRVLQINPKTDFFFQDKETPGKPVSVEEILTTYVNEPDQGMDQDLSKYYPLDPKYGNMGAFKPGLPSQAFRHMYWPLGYISVNAIDSGPHLTSIGEAPERAQLFFDLSMEMARAGHPYWAARFLAWSMHYAEDVTQPFHARQLPSLKFIQWAQYKPDFDATVLVLTYYHLAFEYYVTRVLFGYAGTGAEKQLRDAIGGKENVDRFAWGSRPVRDLAANAAWFSAMRAGSVGALAYEVFPPASEFSGGDLDAEMKNPDSDFWRKFHRGEPYRANELRASLQLIRQCLADAGAAVRSIIAVADGQSKRFPAGFSRLEQGPVRMQPSLEILPAFLNGR